MGMCVGTPWTKIYHWKRHGLTYNIFNRFNVKKYNPLYYLLFVLLIMGSFAAMAQNDYGVKILGAVALAFALLFSAQFVLHFTRKVYSTNLEALESMTLVVIAIILACRIYYIRFPYVEIVFSGAGMVLMMVYVIKAIKAYSTLRSENQLLAYLIAGFYGSIVFYAASMTVVPIIPVLAEPLGGLAFGMLILFIVASLIKREFMIAGDKTSAFAYVTQFKDRSIVLLSLFLLFTAYMGLTKIDLLPRMYSDEFPQAYFELVHQAESGEEKPVEGKFKHEEFKEMYDRFVNRHVGSGKK